MHKLRAEKQSGLAPTNIEFTTPNLLKFVTGAAEILT